MDKTTPQIRQTAMDTVVAKLEVLVDKLLSLDRVTRVAILDEVEHELRQGGIDNMAFEDDEEGNWYEIIDEVKRNGRRFNKLKKINTD